MSDRFVVAVAQSHLGMLLPMFAEHHDPIALWRSAAVAAMTAQLLANLDAFFAGEPLPGDALA